MRASAVIGVDQVEVGRHPELVHAGVVVEGAGCLVLLGAGADVGVSGQGLVGGHVTAGQARRS
jgi:hypothetical protein